MKLDDLLFNQDKKKRNNLVYNQIIIERFNDKIISIIYKKDNLSTKLDIPYSKSLWTEFINLYYDNMMTFHTILNFRTTDKLLKELNKDQFIFICNINKTELDIKNILKDLFIYNKFNSVFINKDDNHYEIL